MLDHPVNLLTVFDKRQRRDDERGKEEEEDGKSYW